MSTEEEVNEIKRKDKIFIEQKRKQILRQKAKAAQKLAEKLRREREERMQVHSGSKTFTKESSTPLVH